ncbi:MAG: CHAT domain-containing protein [Micropruina sp.]
MEPVAVLDASMSLAAARSAMRSAGALTMVVRRIDPRATGAMLWYVLTEDDRERLAHDQVDGSMPLGVYLDLHEHGAGPVRALDHPDVTGRHWTGLVVDGGRAVGWATADPGDDRGPSRGFDFGPGSAFAPPPAFAEPPTSGAEEPADEAGPLGDELDTGSDAGRARPATVEAFPRVDIPATVAPGAAFDVLVGLARQAQADVRGAAMSIPAVARELTVQIKAENFSVAHVRHALPFDPGDVTAHTVAIPVVAPPVTEPWRGRIEVEYSQDGLLIGTAWRELTVDPAAPAEAPVSTAGGEVAVDLDRRVPIDLTVSISRGEGAGTFLWTFLTPHDVPLPDEQVITRLDGDTAETFALRVVREMARVNRNPSAELKVAGVARDVAEAAMPGQFWRVLAPVWRIAKDSGRLPTVLLVSQESLVPWELATTDEDYIVDRTLVDPAAPQILGAQAIVGRWRPAGPETPSGVRRPSTTPAESIAVGALAVVVGEYTPGSGLRPLKEAIAEGQQLTATYTPSAWVKGTATDVATLLKGEYTDRGTPLNAQVLHVAAHGEADPDLRGQAGVILSDSAVKIDETIVLGSAFTRTASPLVFLNCCQLASETGGSLVEGGLAAAFLRAGARAFIAPLWNVTDGVAKDTALLFYAEALGKGRPVGEVMRELRARFTTAFPARDETTPLAYAYYGHPGLVLTREEAH